MQVSSFLSLENMFICYVGTVTLYSNTADGFLTVIGNAGESLRDMESVLRRIGLAHRWANSTCDVSLARLGGFEDRGHGLVLIFSRVYFRHIFKMSNVPPNGSGSTKSLWRDSRSGGQAGPADWIKSDKSQPNQSATFPTLSNKSLLLSRERSAQAQSKSPADTSSPKEAEKKDLFSETCFSFDVYFFPSTHPPPAPHISHPVPRVALYPSYCVV